MKIEGIGQIKGIEQVNIIGQTSVKFADGQILIARIEQIQGDRVMLKNKEGALFMALMQGELGLAEGDMVEVAASGSKDGYVLYLLDIDKEASNAMARQPEIRGTLPGTMAMMKANPGLDPKSAAFLIENNIPDTPENISALSGILRGGAGIGTLLAEILAGLSRDVIEPEQQSAAQSAQTSAQGSHRAQTSGDIIINSMNTETGSAEAAHAVATEAGSAAAEQAAVSANQQNQSPPGAEIITGSTQPDEGAAALQHVTNEQAGMAAAAGATEELPTIPAGNASIKNEITELQSAMENKGMGYAANSTEKEALFEGQSKQDIPVLYNKEQISHKIREMFLKPDEQTGAQLKKTIMDTPDKISALKMMLNRSDKSNKEMYIEKADQAQKQLDMMSGSKRFDYIQIPFFLKNGSERTAELYVFRRTRKKEPGEEGLTVLVALDTQNIGRVETLIKTAGSGISLEFRIERNEIQQEITKRAKTLAKALEKAGYNLKSVRITKLETKTTVLNAAGPPESTGIRSGNVDVKI